MRVWVSAIAVFLTVALPAAAGAAERFAAVNGSSSAGNPCTDEADPCSLERAGNVFLQNDTVTVAPGTYALTDSFGLSKGMLLRGAPGQPRPRLVGTGLFPTLNVNGPNADVVHLYVESTSIAAPAIVTPASGSVEDVIAVSRGGAAGAIEAGVSQISDTVAVQLGPNGTGLAVLDSDVELRNVTALAATNGVGLLVRTKNAIRSSAEVVNTIARGAADDVLVDTETATLGGQAHLSFSNFDFQHSTEAEGGSIDQGPGNQTGTPLFADRDLADVHQVAGSPTINAGTAALPDFSPFDIDGQARVLGSAPDIGADEFVAPATGAVPDTVAPAFLKAPKFSRSSFPAAKSGPAFKPARTYGATITYTLSEPATTTFSVQRPLAGRKSGKKCVKPTRKNRKKKRCTRWSALKGSFADKGTSGVNKVKFSGRVRGKRLKPGKYRLAAVAKDPAGLKSKTSYRNFRIVR